MKTPDIIIQFLNEGLLSFYNTTLMNHQPNYLKIVHLNQQLIGWNHFTRGRITKGLRELTNNCCSKKK